MCYAANIVTKTRWSRLVLWYLFAVLSMRIGPVISIPLPWRLPYSSIAHQVCTSTINYALERLALLYRSPVNAQRCAVHKKVDTGILHPRPRYHLTSSPSSQYANRQQKVHIKSKENMTKTYNSGYSLVVTHLTTNPPVRCLNRAERTGSLVFNVLWSYVEELWNYVIYNLRI